MTSQKQRAAFFDEHPEYAGFGAAYMETVTYENSIMLIQYSFCVSRIRNIKKLIAIKRPEIIYYGTEELGHMCRTQLPSDLRPIIKPHGWYEDTVCVIVKRRVCDRWKQAKELQDAQRQ